MKPYRVFVLPLFAAALLRAGDPPKVYSWPAQNLATIRDQLASGDVSLQPALNRLRQEADDELKLHPLSVLDKSRVPPSGDKHDYLSQAPYWWPDPANPKGPYVRRDGRENPERLQGTDYPAWQRVSAAITTLGLFPLFAEALRHCDDPQFREMFARFAPADARWRLFWP